MYKDYLKLNSEINDKHNITIQTHHFFFFISLSMIMSSAPGVCRIWLFEWWPGIDEGDGD